MVSKHRYPTGCGIGLRLPHLAEVAATRPPAGWIEIHPENFLANPHAAELLQDVASDYPVAVHSVGISIGSASGVDRVHLARVRELVDCVDAFLVSGHLAWSTHEGEYLNDLLPLPYNRATFDVVTRHVDEVQDALGRPYLVENPSSYVGFGQSTLTEAEFLSELAQRTGCKLLCDISNIHVSSHNLGYDPYRYLDDLPAEAIAEFHLGGYTIEKEDGSSSHILIDTHATAISGPAWRLYEYALWRFGPRPALIERDSDLPPLETLLDESARADTILAAVLDDEVRHAVAG